ncbi:hypothetical protein [Streptomyces sp. NPDC006134]|uniref:hypothetical protein n=1 Tax=Streptomyces sp. NPDC006134 TaxID=3154467 RepID=UPI0033C3307B
MTEQTSNTNDETARTEDEQARGEQSQDGEAAADSSQAPEDELPDWARKELTKVRNEATSYRARLREAEEQLSGAKSPEEFEAALAEVKSENARLERSLLVTKVASKYELPELLAEALKGETAEELEAHAKALQSLLAPAPPASLGGGLDPNDGDDGDLDPRKLARLTRR